jgi:hypothetical protein
MGIIFPDMALEHQPEGGTSATAKRANKKKSRDPERPRRIDEKAESGKGSGEAPDKHPSKS